MSPLVIVGILLSCGASTFGDANGNVNENARDINNLAQKFWWANNDSPLSQAASDYKSTVVSSGHPGNLDLSNNPFFNGGLSSSGSIHAGNGEVIDGSMGFLGVQPSRITFSKKQTQFADSKSQNGVPCQGNGYFCVKKSECHNGIVNGEGLSIIPVTSGVSYCNPKSEACCRYKDQSDYVSSGKSSNFKLTSEPKLTVSNYGETGADANRLSGSSTAKPTRDAPFTGSTVDYSNTKFDDDVRFSSSIRGPPYLPPKCGQDEKLVNGQCQPACGPNFHFVNGRCEPLCGPKEHLVGGQCQPICGPNQRYVNGQCQPICGPKEHLVNGQCQPTCGSNERFVNGQCQPNCGPNQRYVNGQCQPICGPKEQLIGGQCRSTCGPNERFVNGQCQLNCGPNERFVGGQCQPICGPNERLVNGQCQPTCGPNQKLVNGQCQQTCRSNERLVNGQCQPTCGPNERFVNGQCQPTCGPNQRYVNGQCQPICGPNERLVNGQCQPSCGPNQNYVNGQCQPTCGSNERL
ncbi:PREDICTED: uncharacterized protein LOC108564763, partial [Nicrophorus vespilloides]|uniref:Uncharacterized protein LOC108564763 n=1 Tax=Nicrophorus vespilloides TaxID=110193 RepID=A0ABM1MXR6_NICVS